MGSMSTSVRPERSNMTINAHNAAAWMIKSQRPMSKAAPLQEVHRTSLGRCMGENSLDSNAEEDASIVSSSHVVLDVDGVHDHGSSDVKSRRERMMFTAI